jgi:hypothetical protein
MGQLCFRPRATASKEGCCHEPAVGLVAGNESGWVVQRLRDVLRSVRLQLYFHGRPLGPQQSHEWTGRLGVRRSRRTD